MLSDPPDPVDPDTGLAATLSLLVVDVDDNESVATAIGSVIESEGRVDVLVNNAGVGGFGDIEGMPLSVFTATMNTNVSGVLRCTQAVLPTMRK